MVEEKINHALAGVITSALEDGKAIDVKCLEVSAMTTITDFMIVAGGSSNRQVRALTERAVEAARESGVKPIGREGEDAGEWVLVDFGDVVLHLMQPQTREFYQLEKLWDSSPAETKSM